MLFLGFFKSFLVFCSVWGFCLFLVFCLFLFSLRYLPRGSQGSLLPCSACSFLWLQGRGLMSGFGCLGFSLWWLLLLWSMASRAQRLSSGPQAQLAYSMCGLQSQERDHTHVPWVGRPIVNLWITREVPHILLFFKYNYV